MKIQFSFDDATLPDIKIAELLEEFNFKDNTVFYFPVMPSVVNEPKGRQSLTNEQQQVIANNFEICSHTISHRLLTRIPLDDAKIEIIDSRKILQDKFNQNINKFSYPRGYANPDLQKTVQDAGYLLARSTLVGYVHQSENPFFEQTTVHVGCDRKEYGGKTWYEYAISMLEIAKDIPNSIYSIFGHGYELNSYPRGMLQFKSLLELLNT